MASLVDVLRAKLEELGEVVKKADISSGWFAIYPTAWDRRAQAAHRRGRSGPNLVVYRTRSGKPRDHYVIPFSVAKGLLTDDTLTRSKVHGSVRWNLTLTDGQLHVSHRPGALDVSKYFGAPLLVEGNVVVGTGGPPNVEADDSVAQGIVEGIERESKVISKSRSRRLRRIALKRAGGVCEACGTDFAALFGGMGLRALQVHHKQQLALRTVPAVTGPDDLAVVCANCHAIIHSNPRAALPMEVLQGLWTSSRTA